MFEKIEKPSDFLDSLIRDTWANKISWDSNDFDYGRRYLSILPIKDTSKFLKIEVFEMGSSSFIKTYLHLDNSTEVSFDNVKSKDNQRERIVRLILSIKEQNYNKLNL